MTKLSEFAYFVSTKIDVKKLTRSNYIGVDNMLQNKNGITKSEYLPDNGYAIAFQNLTETTIEIAGASKDLGNGTYDSSAESLEEAKTKFTDANGYFYYSKLNVVQ